MNRLVSIVIPVYNVESYLETCVESIINQSYKELEIILVDDGSTDRCGDICEMLSAKDNRIAVYHKKNGGLSDARNYGIERAHGELLGFVDSDDYIETGMIAGMVAAIENNNADIAICGYKKVYKNVILDKKPHSRVYTKDQALYQLLRGSDFQDHVWAMVFKTELWEGIRFPKGKLYEDVRTTYKLFLRANRIVTVDESFYNYRQRGSSIVKLDFNSGKLQCLEAEEELLSIPYFMNNNKFQNCIKKRILRTKGYVVQEILLHSEDDVFNKQQAIVRSIQNEYKKNAVSIIRDDGFSTSLKLVAVYSALGYHVLKFTYRKGIMSKLLKERYVLFK